MEANGNFFNRVEEARDAVIALREDVIAGPDMELATTVIEKIETTRAIKALFWRC